MKTFAIALAVASALSLLPLGLLVRATRQIVPGRGPQGGEAVFLLWVLMLAWAWAAAGTAFVSSGLVLGTTPAIRYLVWPAASIAGVTAWVAAAFALLARGSDPSAAGPGLGASAILAGLLAALLLAGSQAIHLRAAWVRA